MTKYRPNALNQSFDSFFTNFFDRPFSDLGTQVFANRPAVNISEEDAHYQIAVAAPGLEKSDFDLQIDKDLLTVKVEKESKSEEEEGKFSRKEFNFSRFSRTFTLPETVVKDNISATYENGVLNITLPKEELAVSKLRRTVEIK